MYESKNMRNLIESVKKVMKLKEAEDTPFNASELKGIEDATKEMIDHSKKSSVSSYPFRRR